MKDIHFIFLIFSVCSCLALHAQPQPPPLNAADFARHGHAKALVDFLGLEGHHIQKDSLLDLIILPNPFDPDPITALAFWYDHQDAFLYRPEAGAFLFTEADHDPPPPTLCAFPDLAGSGSQGQAIMRSDRFCSPIETSRIHRQLATMLARQEAPDRMCDLVDILVRWDPGQATADLVASLQEQTICPNARLEAWVNRLLCNDDLTRLPHSGRITTQLKDQRSWIYQESLGVDPFIYPESVDYYGRILASCLDRQLPAWTALYDLIQTHHSRALYYLAATAYRSEVLHAFQSTIPFPEVLGKLCGMEIRQEDLGQWVRHFFNQHDQWLWSDQLLRFYYYPEVEDHQLLVESWFRYLASSDPEVATRFYQQIIDADPGIVARYSGHFRQILTQWNPVLPPANLPFPEITSRFRADARQREDRLTLPPGAGPITRQFRQNISLPERIALEDSLMQVCSPSDLTALEALALEWVSFPEAEMSLSRVVDHLYFRFPPTSSVPVYLRKAGLFLDRDRGDAASRYMHALQDVMPQRTAEHWYAQSDDASSRAAIEELMTHSRLQRFLDQPAQLPLSDIPALPGPELIGEDTWQEALGRMATPGDHLRFIQYFQVYPREFQSGILLSVFPPEEGNQDWSETRDAMVQLLEYVSGLYREGRDLSWWQGHWQKGHASWSGMTHSICSEFLMEWTRSGSLPPDQLGFILRQAPEMLAHGPEWRDLILEWDQPDRILTLPLDSLSTTTDLPFLLELGLTPDRIASLMPAFHLDRPDDTDVFMRTILEAAESEGTLPDVTNRLFNDPAYRAWLIAPEQAEWRHRVLAEGTSWLEASPWISAFEEASIWAQLIWCQSLGQPGQWLDLLLSEERDPGFQKQILALLCRDLDLRGMQILLSQLDDVDPILGGTLQEQVLKAFALPALDGPGSHPYRQLLEDPRSPSLEAMLRQALGYMSASFVPPVPAWQAASDTSAWTAGPDEMASLSAWMENLLQREYIRPLFGYRPNPRIYPVATALAWWICRFEGQTDALDALKRFRQSGDINELVHAARLPRGLTTSTGINSLFDPD